MRIRFDLRPLDAESFASSLRKNRDGRNANFSDHNMKSLFFRKLFRLYFENQGIAFCLQDGVCPIGRNPNRFEPGKLSSARRKTSGETIERYMKALVDAFLFRRARRFNLKGGGCLQDLGKYYPADPGIKNVLLGWEMPCTREPASLRRLPEESGRRMVVTLDKLGLGWADGVEAVSTIDWLLAG